MHLLFNNLSIFFLLNLFFVNQPTSAATSVSLPFVFSQLVIQQLILLTQYFAPVNTRTSLNHSSTVPFSLPVLSLCQAVYGPSVLSCLCQFVHRTQYACSLALFPINTNKFPHGTLSHPLSQPQLCPRTISLTHAHCVHKADLRGTAESSLRHGNAKFQLYGYICACVRGVYG